jgi:hypothetical protein
MCWATRNTRAPAPSSAASSETPTPLRRFGIRGERHLKGLHRKGAKETQRAAKEGEVEGIYRRDAETRRGAEKDVSVWASPRPHAGGGARSAGRASTLRIPPPVRPECAAGKVKGLHRKGAKETQRAAKEDKVEGIYRRDAETRRGAEKDVSVCAVPRPLAGGWRIAPGDGCRAAHTTTRSARVRRRQSQRHSPQRRKGNAKGREGRQSRRHLPQRRRDAEGRREGRSFGVGFPSPACGRVARSAGRASALRIPRPVRPECAAGKVKGLHRKGAKETQRAAKEGKVEGIYRRDAETRRGAEKDVSVCAVPRPLAGGWRVAPGGHPRCAHHHPFGPSAPQAKSKAFTAKARRKRKGPRRKSKASAQRRFPLARLRERVARSAGRGLGGVAERGCKWRRVGSERSDNPPVIHQKGGGWLREPALLACSSST